jgi:pimeloyl-[acyl-carrier protein] methyl ester esterase
MKLILLPGLDGTGDLYQPLIQAMNIEYSKSSDLSVEVISYPVNQKLEYSDLIEIIEKRLPIEEDFYIVAESFSGVIAFSLASKPAAHDLHKRLKGIVFIASFVSTPSSLAKYVAPLIPSQLLSPNVIPKFIVKKLMLGTSGHVSIEQFWTAVHKVDPKVLIQRIKAISQIDYKKTIISVPCCYIQANQDWLVPAKNLKHFEQCCPNLETHHVNGPHFIAQAQPQAVAQMILQFIK